MTLEVDSFYLPDTAATTYRRQHVKSSIAVEGIEEDEERLRYFHGSGYYELSRADYRGVLCLTQSLWEDALPPYVEVVKFDAGPRLAGEQLRRAALESFRRQMAYRPKRNPWLAFGERLNHDLPELLAGSDSGYHSYAFATVRQCGAAFEIARSFVRGWLRRHRLMPVWRRKHWRGRWRGPRRSCSNWPGAALSIQHLRLHNWRGTGISR